jgi:excisionase family DNA binding protein
MKKISPELPTVTLTKKECARELRMSERTIHTLIQQKLLPAIRIKGSVRIARADLEEFISRQRGTVLRRTNDDSVGKEYRRSEWLDPNEPADTSIIKKVSMLCETVGSAT